MTKIVDESLTPVKMVAVPQHLLVALESSRKDLYAMYPEMGIAQQIEMQIVTDVMWRLANTKWEEVT